MRYATDWIIPRWFLRYILIQFKNPEYHRSSCSTYSVVSIYNVYYYQLSDAWKFSVDLPALPQRDGILCSIEFRDGRQESPAGSPPIFPPCWTRTSYAWSDVAKFFSIEKYESAGKFVVTCSDIIREIFIAKSLSASGKFTRNHSRFASRMICRKVSLTLKFSLPCQIFSEKSQGIWWPKMNGTWK